MVHNDWKKSVLDHILYSLLYCIQYSADMDCHDEKGSWEAQQLLRCHGKELKEFVKSTFPEEKKTKVETEHTIGNQIYSLGIECEDSRYKENDVVFTGMKELLIGHLKNEKLVKIRKAHDVVDV